MPALDRSAKRIPAALVLRRHHRQLVVVEVALRVQRRCQQHLVLLDHLLVLPEHATQPQNGVCVSIPNNQAMTWGCKFRVKRPLFQQKTALSCVYLTTWPAPRQACHSVQQRDRWGPARFIILNTKCLVLDTQFLVVMRYSSFPHSQLYHLAIDAVLNQPMHVAVASLQPPY